MPELPEVETVRRGLVPLLEGRHLVAVQARRPDLRFALPAGFSERLTGQRVARVRRRGKFLLWDLSGRDTLLLHLGMSGRIRVMESGRERSCQAGQAVVPALGRHDHLVFHTDTGATLVFHDPRRFGIADLVATEAVPNHRLLAGLGAEPLDPAFDGAYLEAALAGRRSPVKSALIDQRILAGLGNIYACEALFRARISPRRKSASVRGRRSARLAVAIREVLGEAIAAGGSSLRDYARVDGELGYFQTRFRVYDRLGQPCPQPGCTGTIGRIVQSGRSTFFCSSCQR